MRAEPMREIVVEAVFNDPYDGAIRLLSDAQRFGFDLQSLTLAAKADGIASAIVTLRVPISVDAELVSARLARHPAVQRVSARTDSGEVLLDCLQAVAA
ncbi:hypothetical protein AA309_27680 [Microvirga vignae]|uniref:ACT domain-containing protein n=1 Tax=Microvirga vignae TaxID=1225564 RepID=A0A0H1R4U0_9HYPH|nr:hypothetical protein [Microvirga vignae]KLK90089.1 hypothetical protein AA309_27680 [Microvirga vignae]